MPQQNRPSWRIRPIFLALCWAGGILLGQRVGPAGAWLVAATGPLAALLLMWLRRRAAAVRCWALLTLVLLGGAWGALAARHSRGDDVRQFLVDQPQLAEVVAVVVKPPHTQSAVRGPLGAFAYRNPATLLLLETQAIRVGARMEPASGRVLARIDCAEHRIRQGDRLRATGWLRRVEGPGNPGEVDYRARMAARGIHARLVLGAGGSWQRLEPRPATRLQRLRSDISDGCAATLRIGMKPDEQRLALLDALLLGRREGQLGALQDAFRRVGLGHILAISGAHLVVLLGVAWFAAHLLTHDPRRAALLVLATLGLYLLAVPAEVPVVRAGIMAGVAGLALLSGRRIAGLDLLALAAMIVLAWEPRELAAPGFQLSFGVVAALLLFTRPLSERLRPPLEASLACAPDAHGHHRSWRHWPVNVLAANIVAFCVSMPIVAYHFGIISPLAILLALLALLPVAGVMALGYLKIALGWVLPSGGVLLAGPLEWLTDTTIGLVTHAVTWPGATVELPRTPPPAWTLTALALVAALFAGRFTGRKLALASAAGVCALWLLALQTPLSAWPGAAPLAPPLRLNMLSVSNGSCFLIRVPDRRGQTRAILFDCGSQEYLDVGERSLVPALRALGVTRVERLFISHADMDHYCGVLDVVAEVGVEQVLAPPQLLAEAAARPDAPVAFLVSELGRRGVAIAPVARSWRQRFGEAELELLWPPADLRPMRSNDTSLVLSVVAGGRRALLSGDIQQEATARLLTTGVDLAADIAELPHHGGLVDASADWLAAVSPALLLQSCSPQRLLIDRWAPLLREQRGVRRLTTARHGMVEVTVDHDGKMHWSTFRTTDGGVIDSRPPDHAAPGRPASAGR